LSTVAATVSTSLAPTSITGSAVVEIGYSTNGSDYTWTPGASAKVVARYVKVRATMASGGAMAIVGPVTATAAGMLRRESGSVTTSASAGALVQLASNYAQTKAIQLTANAAVAMQPVYDRVIVSPETGLVLTATLTGAGAYQYQTVSTTAATLASGDRIKFDIYVPADCPDAAEVPQVHLRYSDTTTRLCGGTLSRGQWIAVDTDLTSDATKTISNVNLVVSSSVTGTHTMMVRDLRVTNSSGTVKQQYWSSGDPTANSSYANVGSSNVLCGPANSFLAYCFDGTNTQVAKPLSYTFEGA
jgi:hypothetical protein